MVEELLDDTKLIKVPKALANQLKLVAGRLGTSVSDFAEEALSQALRVDDMGTNLVQAVDMLELVNIHRGAGLVNVPRFVFSQSKDVSLGDFDSNTWTESGKWYAAYISSKLSSDVILKYLEKDLKLFWNLDEAEIIEEDVMVRFRATSFNMSTTLTEWFVLYTKGIFEELGYSINEEEVLSGLVSFKFLQTLI